jgi:hypothetical protein
MLIQNHSTETDTISTTVFITMRKRQALPTAEASIFSSILSRPSSDVEFVCSCLQTPTTTQITVTQTALSTTIITPVVSNNVTIVPVTTVRSTETATIVETVTKTIETKTDHETVTKTITTEATATNTICTVNRFVALDGPNEGNTFYSASDTPSLVRFAYDSSETRSFTLNDDGTVVVSGTQLYLVYGNGQVDVFYSNEFRYYPALHRTMTATSGLSYGAIATVTCSPIVGTAYTFAVAGSVIYLFPVGSVPPPYTAFNVGVIKTSSLC